MCLNFCEFWTWRISCCVIALICIFIGFLYGPYHTVMYFTENRPEISNLLKKEEPLAMFLWSLTGFMWYILITNLFLLLASTRRSVFLLNLYVILTITKLVALLTFCMGFFIFCSAFDRHCFDHSKVQQDLGAAIGLMVGCVLYISIWIVILFVVCSYKLSLQRFMTFILIFEVDFSCGFVFLQMEIAAAVWRRGSRSGIKGKHSVEF